MPHAAFYVVQRHMIWIDEPVTCFNAARSILCGATRLKSFLRILTLVSMPHAAFYVVQPSTGLSIFARFQVSMPHAAFYVVQHTFPLGSSSAYCFNAARSILCGATAVCVYQLVDRRFNAARSILCGATGGYRCHWRRCCFNAARSILCGATRSDGDRSVAGAVSMPHAAFYVVQLHRLPPRCGEGGFNAARSILCGATPSLAALVPRGARGVFWKVVDFLCRFPLMGRNFHRKITASIGAFPCAAQGCAKMENRDGRMRLCGIAVAFSTFLHHGCIISENP